MVHTLMLQCLLPCLSPDHDFEQLVYALWLHYLVLSAGQLLEKSTEGTQRAAPCFTRCLALSWQVQAAWLTVNFVLCHMMITLASCLGRTTLQSSMCTAKRTDTSLSGANTDLGFYRDMSMHWQNNYSTALTQSLQQC